MGSCSCTVFRNLCCCTRCFRCKNFCLLPAVFSSRSFENDLFTQEKLCAMQVSQVGKFFARRFVAKTAKTFLLYSLFFAVEVLIVSCLHRQNSVQCKFRRWTVLPTAFFLCSNNRQMFCNCKPSVGFVGFALSFSTKTVAFCFVISCLSLLWI